MFKIKKNEKTKSKEILINITRIFEIKAKEDKLPQLEKNIEIEQKDRPRSK